MSSGRTNYKRRAPDYAPAPFPYPSYSYAPAPSYHAHPHTTAPPPPHPSYPAHRPPQYAPYLAHTHSYTPYVAQEYAYPPTSYPPEAYPPPEYSPPAPVYPPPSYPPPIPAYHPLPPAPSPHHSVPAPYHSVPPPPHSAPPLHYSAPPVHSYTQAPDPASQYYQQATQPTKYPPFQINKYKRLPTIHEEAAQYLVTVLNENAGLRHINLKRVGGKAQGAVYALITSTFKNLEVIDKVIHEANLPCAHIHPVLLKIFVYDILMGQDLMGRTKEEEDIMGFTQKLRNTYDQFKNKGKAQEGQYVRYIRVNTSAKSTEDCVKQLISEKYEQVDQVTSADAGKKIFCVDPLVPDLLVFPPDLNTANHPLFHSKVFMKSEKASGFPVMALDLQKGWHVIDACAAPGGKTVHMANVMENDGKIFAFEQDKKRTEMLLRNVEQYGATCVTVSNQDFLKVDPQDDRYSQVQAILVDPSCSGSGTIFMQCDKMPLEQYAETQLELVCHAFKFPSARVVVYSTCSINEVENEDVVKRVLAKEGSRWKLAKAVPEWHRRGLPVMEGADMLLRTQYETDHTMGFFVAKFEKIQPNEEGGADPGTVSSDSKNSKPADVTKSPNISTKNNAISIATRNTTNTTKSTTANTTANTTNKTNTNIDNLETQTETAKKTADPSPDLELSHKASDPSTPEPSHKTSPPSASEPSTSEPTPDTDDSSGSPYMEMHSPDLEYHSDDEFLNNAIYSSNTNTTTNTSTTNTNTTNTNTKNATNIRDTTNTTKTDTDSHRTTKRHKKD